MYKHWNVFFNAQRIKKKEKAWIMFIIGMASPNDSTVTGRIIFGKKKNGEDKPYECKKVTVKNNEPYMLNTPRIFVIKPDFAFKVSAESEVDNVLQKTVVVARVDKSPFKAPME